MCLVIEKDDELKTAKNNLIRYKIVKKDCKGYYSNRFVEAIKTFYRIGKVATAEGELSRDTSYYYSYDLYSSISVGLIHSYKRLSDAREELRAWYHESLVILKIQIPKGAQYIDGYARYAPQLSLKKRIKTETGATKIKVLAEVQ